MRLGKRVLVPVLVFSGIGITVVTLLATDKRGNAAKRVAPSMQLLAVEKTGVLNDHDQEVWRATLALSNSEALPQGLENSLFIKPGKEPIHARMDGRWVPAESQLVSGCLYPNQVRQFSVVLPGPTDACQVSLRFTGMRERFSRYWVARRLPRAIQKRFSLSVRRWIGFPKYGPDGKWQDAIVEIPVTAPNETVP